MLVAHGNDPSRSSSGNAGEWLRPELSRRNNLSSSCATTNGNGSNEETMWYDDDSDGDDGDRTIYNWPLPPEVVSVIVDFAVSDHGTAGRLAGINRAWHGVVTETHPTLWWRLAAQRWRICPVVDHDGGALLPSNSNNNNSDNDDDPNSDSDSKPTPAEVRGAYRARHLTDRRVRVLAVTLARQMRPLPGYGLEFGWHWGSSFWRRLADGLAGDANDDGGDNYTLALDGVRRLAREGHHSPPDGGGEGDGDPAVFPALTRCVATHVLDALHAAQIQGEWRALLLRDRNHVDGDDGVLLEEGAFLVARSLVSPTDLVGDHDNDDDDLSAYGLQASMEAQLDAYAAQLRARLSLVGEDNNDNNDPIAAVRALVALAQFRGVDGDDYYSVRNSSLHAVLASRRGIPLTLAVLYKLILRRCRVPVDLVGLPGHVVLGVPANSGDGGGGRFLLDVFRGHWLTVRDCQELVRLRGLPWRDAYLTEPLPARDALERMLHNVAHCLGRRRAWAGPPGGVRRVVQLERAHNLLRILRQSGAATGSATAVTTATTTQELTLDPQVFADHGLIDAAAAQRCTEACLARALVPAGNN